ncbi:mating-type protein MAT alpha 1 [Aureobasidium pullulans]|uniref:Mating-type protein MAT-1 n=1 Tax=Aureobasidium pullulans TaxID=5580 RepID=A0AB74JT31_AURPU|nr:mating-type protein MAT alpha 1 [Aureobasidium pullulans]
MSATFMPESMALLLEKYSPEQIAEVIDAVMKMRPVAAVASTTPATVAGIGSVSTSAITERKKRAKKSTAASKNAHAQTSPRAAGSIAPTRPLNSWMAFRSYHSPIFKSYQQKDISGFLTCMWQNDPFKAKWSILAKAYSIIRESNSKSDAPLDMFLAVTCPLIGVIPRDEYLRAMGWTIAELDDGVKHMERLYTPQIASFPESILTTNMSSEDIVAHCLRVSYVRQNDTDVARNNQGSTAALTMAAQPTSNSNQVQQNNLAAHTRGMSGAFDMDAQSASNSSQVQQSNLAAHTRGMSGAFDMVAQPESAQQFMPPQSNSAQRFMPAAQSTFYSPQTASNTSSPGQFVVDSEQAQQDQQDDHDYFNVQDALNANNNGAVGASGAVRQTVHDLSSQQYPFMDEFDPFSASALEFDPFSMSHDAAFASNSIGTYLAPGDSVFPETFDIDDLLSSDLFDMTK